ncbi:MAG: exosortase/archaeosortase family protein [Candidatus Thorarchaeota archaeon]
MPNKTSSTTALRDLYLPLAVITASFIALYYHVIARMVVDWSVDDNYSHGFLIPLISGYLIWQKRADLSEISCHPSNTGLFLLAGGLAFFLVGNLGAELFTMRFSILIVLLGLVVYIVGWEFAKAVSLPIGYLIFMIPLPAIIWYKIAFPLKLFATRIATTVLQWLKLSAYSEGNIIHLSSTSLQVVNTCSGLRSLTSLLALSAAFALITYHSKTRKWVLFLSAIPIAILVNVIRLAATALLSEYYGVQVTQGFLHGAAGILVFILAFILIYMVHLLLQRTVAENSRTDTTRKTRSTQ